MRWVVIGGGIGGLSAALELRDRGHQVTILEKQARTGGKIGTVRENGWEVELGPAGVLDNAPATQALFARLKLEVIPSDDSARRRFLFLDGKLRQVPSSPPTLLTSRTLGIRDKWRIFREPWAKPRGKEDESIAEFCRRRFGSRLTERFVEPVVQGVFAGDIERLSLRACFPLLNQLEAEHGSVVRGLLSSERTRSPTGEKRRAPKLVTLRGGMAALTDALTVALGADVQTNIEVKSLSRIAGEWVIRTGANDLRTQGLILALPPFESAALLRTVDREIADAYGKIREASIAAVSLGYLRGEVAHPLNGFGFLIPKIEAERPLGAIWMTSAFPAAALAPADHTLLRFMIGGDRDPSAARLSDDALIEAAVSAAHITMNIDARPRFRHVVRYARGIPQYDVGHSERVALIEERGKSIHLFGVGAALRGVSVNDLIRDAGELSKKIGA